MFKKSWPNYELTDYINWVKSSWTHSTLVVGARNDRLPGENINDGMGNYPRSEKCHQKC